MSDARRPPDSGLTRSRTSCIHGQIEGSRSGQGTEQDQQNQGGNASMQGQLGHHDEDEELKDADADLSG
jgi:hypothetical protein